MSCRDLTGANDVALEQALLEAIAKAAGEGFALVPPVFRALVDRGGDALKLAELLVILEAKSSSRFAGRLRLRLWFVSG